MTLFEVLLYFLKRAKIKRLSWLKDIWMETTDSQLVRLMTKEIDGAKLVKLGETFNLYDLQATDWVIIK